MLVSALALIIIVQNASAVTVRFLVWEAQLSQVLLLAFTLAIGFALGLIVSSRGRWRR